MKNALIISGVFHVSLLITAAMDIPWFDDVKDVEMVVIPIEMVDISDITRTVAIAKKPEPQKEKPKPPQKRPERRAEMPPPPPMLSTMPLPTQTTKQTAKPKPPVKRAAAPKVTQRSRPKPPSKYTETKMAALLNKIPEKLSITERLAERFGPKEQKATSLDVQRQTMSIKAAFRLKIEGECWNPPSGALDAGKLIVVVNFNLSQDGRIIGQPRADDYARMSGPLKVAADSALRAVRMCAPYSDLKLPKDMYDQWKEIKLTFDPSDMLS